MYCLISRGLSRLDTRATAWTRYIQVQVRALSISVKNDVSYPLRDPPPGSKPKESQETGVESRDYLVSITSQLLEVSITDDRLTMVFSKLDIALTANPLAPSILANPTSSLKFE
jgi:hypothetical protein